MLPSVLLVIYDIDRPLEIMSEAGSKGSSPWQEDHSSGIQAARESQQI